MYLENARDELYPGCGSPCVILPVDEVLLQRARLDARFLQLLCGARGRGKAFDLIILSLRGLANHCERGRLPRASGAIEPHDLITVPQHLLDGRSLAVCQMGMLSNDDLSGVVAGQHLVLALTVTDAIDGLLFQLQHLRRGERSAWRMRVGLNGDEVAALNPTIDLTLDVVDAGLTEGSLQGISTERPLGNDGLPFQCPGARERHRPCSKARPIVLGVVVARVPFARLTHSGGLTPEPRGQLLVPSLHFVMGDVGLRVACLVGGDLRRRGTCRSSRARYASIC